MEIVDVSPPYRQMSDDVVFGYIQTNHARDISTYGKMSEGTRKLDYSTRGKACENLIKDFLFM